MIQTTAPALLAAVNGASSKMTTKASMAILGCVRIAADGVTATDLELEGHQSYAASGDDVGFYLERAALKRILAKIGDAAIVLTTRDDGAVAVTLANGSAFILAQSDASEWPGPFGDSTGHVDLDVPADTLRNMLERALVACSKDASRPVLAAICVTQHADGFEVVATDSYRLHILGHGDVGRTDGKRTLLPRAFAEAIVERIKKLKPARVTLRGDDSMTGSKPMARAEVGDWTGSCRVTQGTFPNYRSLIPDNAEGTAVLPAAATLAALGLAEATNPRNAPVRLTLGAASSLSIDAHMGVAFSAPLDVATDLDLTIGYNAAFLGDLVTAGQSDAPILSVISPLRPSWLTSVGCAQCGTPIDGHGVSFHGLIMPIKINEVS